MDDGARAIWLEAGICDPVVLWDASLASSGMRALELLLARSWPPRKACRVLRKRPANSVHEFDELMSTMRIASMRGRGGSAMIRWATSPDCTQEFLLGRNEDAEVEWVHGNRDLPGGIINEDFASPPPLLHPGGANREIKCNAYVGADCARFFRHNFGGFFNACW